MHCYAFSQCVCMIMSSTKVVSLQNNCYNGCIDMASSLGVLFFIPNHSLTVMSKKLSIIAVLKLHVFCAYYFMFYQKTFATVAASIWLLPRVYSLLNWNLEESLYYFQLLPTVLSLVSCHITFMSIKYSQSQWLH